MLKIAICGKACSGKTTVAQIIREELDPLKIVTLKLATPIYNTLEALDQKKHRAFMQQFGDLAKEHFGEGIFVRVFKSRVRMAEASGVFAALCDDLRFPYEMDAMKQMGFITIYIDSGFYARTTRAQNLGLDLGSSHSSETSIDQLRPMCDYVVDNGGGFTRLTEQVKLILSELMPKPREGALLIDKARESARKSKLKDSLPEGVHE